MPLIGAADASLRGLRSPEGDEQKAFGHPRIIIHVTDLTYQLHKDSRAHALLSLSPFVRKKVPVSLGS